MPGTRLSRHHRILPAIYRASPLPEYAGNPLVEALPAVPEVEDLMDALGVYPHITDEERSLPPSTRMQAAMRLNKYFEVLPEHFDVALRINLVLRSGYEFRNPTNPDYHKELVTFYRTAMAGTFCPISPFEPTTAPGFALFGVSGVGKSTAIERTLAFLPQAICHKRHAFVQIVWLKLDCPADGSLKQLLLNITTKVDDLIGTNYLKLVLRSRNIDRIIIDVAKIAASHHLGLLVIDEIQNLLDANGVWPSRLLNFIVSLENELKIPVLIIGTLRALTLLQATLRAGRRVGNFGGTIWSEMKVGDEWDYFLRSMWKFQWTKNFVALDADLGRVMHFQTAGIHALPIRLFQISQIVAIRDGSERLSPKLLVAVADKYFKLLQPMLAALRDGDYVAASRYEDIFAEWLPDIDAKVNALATAPSIEDLAKVRAQRNSNRLRAVSNLVSICESESFAQDLIDQLLASETALNTAAVARLTTDVRECFTRAGSAHSDWSLEELVQAGKRQGRTPLESLRNAGLISDHWKG